MRWKYHCQIMSKLLKPFNPLGRANNVGYSNAKLLIHHDYLADYLLNPSKAKPGTTMPSVLNAVPEEDRETVAKAIAAFLGSTGEIAIAPPVSAGIEQGRQLFHQVGCVACHQPIEGDHSPLASSTPLPILDQKYSVPSLTQFLSDPLAVRSGGRMPHLGLSDDEVMEFLCSSILCALELVSTLF